MTPWEKHYNAERELIAKMLAPAPTRAETIKAMWEAEGRAHWPTVATEFGMMVVHDLDIVPRIHYEQKRYGDVIVIEAEGVIVERTPIAPR